MWTLATDEQGAYWCDTPLPDHLQQYAYAALRFHATAFRELARDFWIEQSAEIAAQKSSESDSRTPTPAPSLRPNAHGPKPGHQHVRESPPDIRQCVCESSVNGPSTTTKRVEFWSIASSSTKDVKASLENGKDRASTARSWSKKASGAPKSSMTASSSTTLSRKASRSAETSQKVSRSATIAITRTVTTMATLWTTCTTTVETQQPRWFE